MDIHGPLQTRGETRCPGGVSVSCFASRTRRECPCEVHQKRQQGIPPEQARPGHSQDSLAMPSTAQPGTVGPVEEKTIIEGKQPNEGIILQEYPGEERSDKS